MNEEEIQGAVIDRIHDFLMKEGERIKADKTKSLEQKLLEVDVLLDTMKFLGKYKKNIKVLQEDLSKKKYEREM